MIWVRQSTPQLSTLEGLTDIDAADLRSAEQRVTTPWAIAVAAINDNDNYEHRQTESVRLMLKRGWRIPAWNESSYNDGHQVLYLLKRFRHAPNKMYKYNLYGCGCSDSAYSDFQEWKNINFEPPPSEESDWDAYDDADRKNERKVPLQLYAGPPLTAHQRVVFRKAKWMRVKGTPFYMKGRTINKLPKRVAKELGL